jgi:hypothetical protein
MTLGLLYNLYADRLLGLNLVPQSIYEMQSAFYPTVAQTYGVPLDTRSIVTKCSFYSTPFASKFKTNSKPQPTGKCGPQP